MDATTTKKKKISSFSLPQALRKLQAETLRTWELRVDPLPPSEFFNERIHRLRRVFDLTISERAKELLVDAICEEAIQRHEALKVWKAAAIQGESVTDVVDYVVAENIAYLRTPLLCIVEAKKDDFAQGLAQCLVEMQAFQWNNEQAGKKIDVYGIVTNGTAWQFYKLDRDRQDWETSLYAISNIEQLLGILDYVFTKCEENL